MKEWIKKNKIKIIVAGVIIIALLVTYFVIKNVVLKRILEVLGIGGTAAIVGYLKSKYENIIKVNEVKNTLLYNKKERERNHEKIDNYDVDDTLKHLNRVKRKRNNSKNKSD